MLTYLWMKRFPFNSVEPSSRWCQYLLGAAKGLVAVSQHSGKDMVRNESGTNDSRQTQEGLAVYIYHFYNRSSLQELTGRC